jgi:hypothetical protein
MQDVETFFKSACILINLRRVSMSFVCAYYSRVFFVVIKKSKRVGMSLTRRLFSTSRTIEVILHHVNYIYLMIYFLASFDWWKLEMQRFCIDFYEVGKFVSKELLLL